MTSKVILLTGASKGIGLAIAKHLLAAKENHKLFLVARSEEPLEGLKKEYPGRVEYLSADLSDLTIGPKAISLALQAFAQIDSLILNHGVLSPVTRIADCDPVAWRALYDVNFFSVVSFIQSALPTLRLQHGNIILTSSGASTGVYSTWGAYGSSKAALNHLALTLAAEEPDVTTIAIRPGVVDTDMQVEVRGHGKVMDEKDMQKFKTLHEVGKLLRPEQPGHVMARLAVSKEGRLKGLGGKYLSWDAKELAGFQD